MKEIGKKCLNSILAGVLVMLGGMASGEMTYEVCYFAMVAGAIVTISQFKELLSKVQENKRGETCLFGFV